MNHARGLLVEGRFRPSAAARAICRATTFAGRDLPVLARFSSSTGNPTVAEDDPAADPRGLALTIGRELTFVGHSVESFPARTGAEFLAFIEALNAGEEPGRMARHLQTHAAARRFGEEKKRRAISFLAGRYHMLHPYRLLNSEGSARIGRISVAGLGTSEAVRDDLAGADVLERRLRYAVSHGSAVLQVLFEEASRGVDVGDVSKAWPMPAERIVLGEVAFHRVAADQMAQAKLVFDPATLPPGIAFAGDGLIADRLAAYRIAFARRTETPGAPAG